MNTKLLVNGKLVKGRGDDLDILDPATGKVIAQVSEASEEQIAAAVKAAAVRKNAVRQRRRSARVDESDAAMR